MAIIAGATEIFTLGVLLASVDTNSVVATRMKTFEFNPTTITTHALANTAALAFLALLDAVDECDILDWWINVKHVGDIGSVTSSGTVYKEAVLTLNPLGGGKKISHSIFAPADAMIAGRNVIETNTDLLAYLNSFESGGDFLLSDGEQIVASNQIAASKTRMASSGKVYG